MNPLFFLSLLLISTSLGAAVTIEHRILLHHLFTGKTPETCQGGCEPAPTTPICGDFVFNSFKQFLVEVAEEKKKAEEEMQAARAVATDSTVVAPIVIKESKLVPHFKLHEPFKVTNGAVTEEKSNNLKLSKLLKNRVAELVKIDHLKGSKKSDTLSIIRYTDKKGKSCTMQVYCNPAGNIVKEVSIDAHNCINF